MCFWCWDSEDHLLTVSSSRFLLACCGCRCFEAVRELIFNNEGEIVGMFSIEGEKIPFLDAVNPAASGELPHNIRISSVY